MTIDANSIAALVRQLREDDAAMTEAPWAGRNRQTHLNDPTFAWHTVDGPNGKSIADIDMNRNHAPANAAGIARTRNSLSTIADTLQELQSEVERSAVREALAVKRGNDFADGLTALTAERNRLHADLERATTVGGDHQSIASRRMVDTVMVGATGAIEGEIDLASPMSRDPG